MNESFLKCEINMVLKEKCSKNITVFQFVNEHFKITSNQLQIINKNTLLGVFHY